MARVEQHAPRVPASTSALDTLLSAAVLAPSGDNTQPWQFTVDRENWTILVDVNPKRDESPMNAGQRMAWIAIGAAIENMVHTAESNGWQYELTETTGERPVRFRLQPTAELGELDPLLKARATNRKVYKGGAVSSACIAALQNETAAIDAISAHWITDRSALTQIGNFIARADALILGTKPIRDAFLAKVRFDQPANATVDEGLSLGSLEVSAVERAMLGWMRYVPDGPLRLLGGRRVFAKAAKRLALSSAGLCLITGRDDSLASKIPVGRVWQRAWLALANQKLACQPMMSLLVLQNIRDHASKKLLEAVGVAGSLRLLDEFSEFYRGMSLLHVHAIMRFGDAEQPTTVTGRLPAHQSLAMFPKT
jgi:hypothetical protein